MLRKTDEAGTDFLSTFFTFDVNFRNFKDWTTFCSDILDDSLSQDLCDFTTSRLNGVRDPNCRSFFILWSSLPLIIGTFVIESTAFKNTLTREHFATTLLRTKCVGLILHGQKTYPHYHFSEIFCHTKNIAWSLFRVYCLKKEVHCLTKEIFCVAKDWDNPQIRDSADNSCQLNGTTLFSRENIKTPVLVKTPFFTTNSSWNICKFIFVWKFDEMTSFELWIWSEISLSR